LKESTEQLAEYREELDKLQVGTAVGGEDRTAGREYREKLDKLQLGTAVGGEDITAGRMKYF
jgi:hypothetical protein